MSVWHPGNAWKGLDPILLTDAGVVERDGVIVIPYRRVDGSVLRERFIATSGRTWWGPGEELVPFGLETLPDPEDAGERALLVAEGESDALALREAFAGVTSESSIRGWHVLGVPGASCWRPEWRAHTERFPVIYPLGDGDVAGRAFNSRVWRDLPWARPVQLPDGEDARSILQRDGARALDSFRASADATARVWVAFRIARTLGEFEALLEGQELRRAA